MGFTVEELKANMAFGGARPNKFNVLCTNRVDGSGDIKFQFSCKASSLPASEIGVIDVYYKGRAVKFMGDRPPFPNWTVTVYNDEDFLVRNAFERWLSAMNAHVGNVMSAPITPNPYSYKADAVVTHESTGSPNLVGSSVPIKQVKIVGMLPVRVGEIVLDWETTNTIETFEVEFAYDYWIDMPSISNAGALLTTDQPSNPAI